MKKLIGISRESIRRNNNRRVNNQPVVRVTYPDRVEEGRAVIIYDSNGVECARVVYDRDNPQRGMNAWIETENEIKIL